MHFVNVKIFTTVGDEDYDDEAKIPSGESVQIVEPIASEANASKVIEHP